MGDINPSIPVVGQPDATEEPKIVTAFGQIVAAVNDIDSANITDGVIQDVDLQSALLDKLGVSAATTTRRGKSIIATAESTSATSYAIGNLATPDRVSGIVLPADGLIVVGYQALWQNTVTSNGRAAIFIGANQLKTASNSGGAPVVQEATGNISQINTDISLSTQSSGLFGGYGQTVAMTDVTTGQVIGCTPGPQTTTVAGGGLCSIFAAAGTYDVSVQFKNQAAGSLTVKSRRLWVWTMGF
jgi:hypothetical protein